MAAAQQTIDARLLTGRRSRRAGRERDGGQSVFGISRASTPALARRPLCDQIEPIGPARPDNCRTALSNVTKVTRGPGIHLPLVTFGLQRGRKWPCHAFRGRASIDPRWPRTGAKGGPDGFQLHHRSRRSDRAGLRRALLGVLFQLIGEARSAYEWLLTGLAAAVGGFAASEFVVGWRTWDPLIDGLAIVPALLGGVSVGVFVEVAGRFLTGGTYRTPSTT